ncbi:MAG: TrkH family potassium uptake protein [Lachnospiraceae bacterium]|nr:TrkH family potassium uptake protein [Lachnospiraceae bacterium]
MNYRVVFYILGWILRLQAALLLLPAVVGLIYQEMSGLSYLITAVIALILSFLMAAKKPENRQIYAREGYAIVGLAWLVMSLVGAIPFVMSGDIPNYIDALFETASGFTTTGSSILTEVEHLTHAGLFWRSFTHWVGGMGVMVFMLALVPMLGGTTLNLMKAESPGPVVGKLVPRIRESAAILYKIYLFITIVEALLLRIFGMDWFQALTTTFGTVGTGGFAVTNDSLASFSPSIQIIITIFMLLCGVNFTFYFLLLQRKLKAALKLEEVRVYFLIVIAASALIAWNTHHLYATTGETVRHSALQVASIITTTGFASTDFDMWPMLSKTILVTLMFIGACAGSTGGGIKVSRIMLMVKGIRKEVGMITHPRAVRKIRIDGAPVAVETVRSTNVFIAIYCVIFFASMLIISIDEFDFTTNFTAVAATINNIGPGLNMIGPTGNFAAFSPLSKIVLIFDMLAGRLEIFPILLMLSLKNWKRYN